MGAPVSLAALAIPSCRLCPTGEPIDSQSQREIGSEHPTSICLVKWKPNNLPAAF